MEDNNARRDGALLKTVLPFATAHTFAYHRKVREIRVHSGRLR